MNTNTPVVTSPVITERYRTGRVADDEGDGSTSTFTVLLDNYFNPPDTPDNDVIATTRYLNSQGIGGRPRGQRQQTVYVFYTGVPISAGKTVRAVTLPTGGAIPASGRITGMHVFAIGVG